jgi:hypothetical protein
MGSKAGGAIAMALGWSGWRNDLTADPAGADYLTPYADWYLNVEMSGLWQGRFPRLRQRGGTIPFAVHDLPLPKRAIPPGAEGVASVKDRKDVLKGLTQVPGEKDVIIGVIDEGIAIAHERFRRAGGIGTRILSHWQQGGDWADQPHLPFGRELMQAGIDGLMGGVLNVDEGQFNQDAGLADFTDPFGPRWVETAAPHGTHVADLAAGCDPFATDPDLVRLRDRAHLITVELAPRISIGPGGSFLEDCAIWAIRHIVDTADAIWEAQHKGKPGNGFAVVINLSYGFNAGPKAGTLALQKYVRVLNDRRDQEKRAPVRLVMPAGNENLAQGSAILGGRREGEKKSLNWRIQPEDRTSGYAEVWTDPDLEATGDDATATEADTAPPPIWLMPPGGPDGPGTAGSAGQVCDLTDGATGDVVARIYCRRSDSRTDVAGLDAKVYGATGYILCVAPTWRLDQTAAPSGAWRISLGQGSLAAGGRATGPLAKLHIQSDQNLSPGRSATLLSYFEEDAATNRYSRFHDDTSPRDTYQRHPVTGAITGADSTGPVRRQNTMNAVAGAFGILTIGGYRATDGWPTAYSGTARGFRVGGMAADARNAPEQRASSGGGKAGMEAAGITDDGAWHIGRLAAGGRSGATVLMQGTSFATAEATRLVALRLLDWKDGRVDPAPNAIASERDFIAVAQSLDHAASPAFGFDAGQVPTKLGHGRLPRQKHGRVARSGG